jgi:DNA-binding transcriptional LysR family regulator
MRFDKIDLNLFVVMDAIYRERSVTRAAGRLHITQPAISNSLARLREAFDDQLFVRTPEGMAPTPVTENVIGDVRRALGLLSKSVGVNARFDAEKSEKVFRLAMSDLAETLILPTLMQKLSEDAPNASITCYYLERETAASELKAGNLDLLLDSPVFNARELETKPLATLPYVVAMRSGHPLARKKLTVDEYLAGEHLHVSGRRKGRGQVDIGLHTIGKARRIAMRLQNYQVAAKIAEQTSLLWTTPKAMANLTGLIQKEPPFKIEPVTWNLFWHRSADDDPANIWIRNRVTELIPNNIKLHST